MGLEVYFNDMPLHENLLILGVERTILPPRENHSKKVPSMFGEHFTGYTYKPKELTVKCFLEGEDEFTIQESLMVLADILNVTEPAKLSVSDEVGKYVWAVPDGSFNYKNVAGTNVEFNIKFICFDPYKYAEEVETFEADSQKIVTVANGGSVETYPTVSVDFKSPANFLQITSYTGETVLIGQRPDLDKETATGDSVVLRETCETMTDWTPAGNVLDSYVKDVSGTVAVNGGGYALICSQYGTNTAGWHGGAVRRNIGQNVKDFKVGLTLAHNSKGDVKGTGATSKPPVTSSPDTPSVKYQITASPSLIIREGRSTSTKRKGSIPKGKVVSVSEIAKGWGKVTYNSITGYISMTYTKKYVAPATSSSNTYQATGDVYVRSGAGSKYKALTVAKKGTKATVSSSKNGWHKVTVNGKTGYSYSKYWKKVASVRTVKAGTARASAENQAGRLEVYGFDQSGNKLFKCVLRDSEKWYEYTQPEVFFGNKLVLHDKKSCPDPKRKKVKDSSGKLVTTNVDSGRFGDWNEFYGDFFITRTTNSKGQQVWKAEVHKKVNGKVVKTLKTKSLVSSDYPTGDLNHIVVWFGQYKEEIPTELMSVNHVQVTALGKKEAIKNFPLFEDGDRVVIDFEAQEVTLNDIPYMKEVDIGSEFFSVPTGESEFILASDDNLMEIEAGIVNRWL